MGAADCLLVLVVDDYEDGRQTLAEFLSMCGFALQTAANGREAIELAKRIRPGVIVMDLSMPVMDGWEATRELKAQPETRDIPVLAITAYGHEDAHRRALEAGCAEVMIKPVDPQRLEERIRHYCEPPPSLPPPVRAP
jgi:CheY-like chemotaxis protein